MGSCHLKLALCALFPLSLMAQDGTWIATSSSELELGSNWSGSSTPTGVATFDSTVFSVNLYPQVSLSDSSLSVSNFTFPNQANFIFTVNGPSALSFTGTGCGITGTNTNTTIIASNAATGMPLSQLIFSGANASVGDANIFAVVEASATLANDSGTRNLSQILFDGSGDSPSQNCSVIMDSSTAAIYVNNYGSITTSLTSVNNVGQVIFDGSGGISSGVGGTGSCDVTIEGHVTLTVDNAANQTIGNGYQGNNSAQVLFDGSGGFSSAAGGVGYSTVTIGGEAQILTTLTDSYVQSNGIGNNVAQIAFDGSGGTSFGAGGQGHSTVVIKDSAVLSATTPGYGYVGYYSSGKANDTAQILFSGNGGLGYGGAGQGSSSVTITDSAILFASAKYYMAGV